MIRDNEKGTCTLINVAVPEDRIVITKKAEKISTYRELKNKNSAHVECESKSDVGNNKGYWNHFQITQKIPEQNRGKSRS
jgi:phage pi2 protein 07